MVLFYDAYTWVSDHLDNKLSVTILNVTFSPLTGQVPGPCFICFTWGLVRGRIGVFRDLTQGPPMLNPPTVS